MARPTAAERRLDYLRIGADLVTGFGDAGSPAGPLEALANVKVSDVARHAGVTKGALYHLWDSQDDYRRDLLQHLLDQVEKEGLERAEQIIAEAVDDEGRPFIDVTDLAVHLSTGSYRDLRDDRGPRRSSASTTTSTIHGFVACWRQARPASTPTTTSTWSRLVAGCASPTPSGTSSRRSTPS